MNDYLKFYEKHKISPVNQNIDDFGLHLLRRQGLYRQLGIPNFSFEGKRVLEVGPGGGFNSLATYTFKPAAYMMIEPNSTGFEQLKNNFETFGFGKNVEFCNTTLEEYEERDLFDIVLCEGLVPGLAEKEKFLSRLSAYVKPGGVLVITCADEISVFFEIARKHLANLLLKGELEYQKKIESLVDVFGSHLDTLEGMTRNYDDWCADNLLGDAIYYHTFSIADAIAFFEREYYFYGGSPDIYKNYTWYKALPTDTVDYNRHYTQHFNELRHNFLDYRYWLDNRQCVDNIKLSKLCRQFMDIVKSLQNGDGIFLQSDLIINLNDICRNVKGLGEGTRAAIDEILAIVLEGEVRKEKVRKLKALRPAFGRGQSYISLTKK